MDNCSMCDRPIDHYDSDTGSYTCVHSNSATGTILSHDQGSDWFDGWETFEEVTKELFDDYTTSRAFMCGPLLDTFGDGPGEPYVPYRQAFGILKDGRKIRAWVLPPSH